MNRRRFILNGLLLTAVGIVMRSIGIAFNSYVTKTVGAQGIGLFTLIMNIYSFAVTFATSGISLTVTRCVAEAIGEDREGECPRIMKFAAAYSLIFSLTAAFVLFFGAEYFSVYILGDARSVKPLRVLSFSLIPLSLSSAIGGYFIGVKRVGKNAAVQVLTQFFKIPITVLLIINMKEGGAVLTVIGMTLAITLTEIFGFLCVYAEYLFDRRKIRRTSGKKKTRFTDITSTALPLALSAYIRSALLTLEHTLIPKGLIKRGKSIEEALSSYGILHGMALPMLLYPMSVLSSFAGLLVPEFAEAAAKGEKKRMQRLTGEALEKTLSYASAAAVIMYVFSEEIGYVLYDSYYAGKYLAMMSAVIPIMYLDHVADSMLKGIGEQVYSMWVNIADALLSVALVWILIPIMDIEGYALVIVGMEGFNFALSISRLYKKIPFKINFIQGFLLPFAAAALSAGAVRRLFVMNGSEAGALTLFLKITFAVCIFTAIYLCMKKIGKAKAVTDFKGV